MDTEANRKTLNAAVASDSQPTLDVNPNYPSLNWGDPKPLVINPVFPVGIRNNPCTAPIQSKTRGLFGLPAPSGKRSKKRRRNETHGRRNLIEKGLIKYFCRGSGHGFIVNERDGEEIFVHISDIEGDFVPREGDEVTFRITPIPPKLEDSQAIRVRIVTFTPEVHLKWDSPLLKEERNENIQTFVVN